MITKIKVHTLEQHINALASYLPNGKLWAAKFIEGSNMRSLLKGLSIEVLNAEAFLTDLQNDFLPDTTEQFIDEWEKALGIPDDCFSGNGSPDIRRRDILIKLASLGVQTKQDFISLAQLFGITVNVLGGIESGETFSTPKEARFTIVVTFQVDAANEFPLTFPFPFGDEVIALVECLFRKLKPSNCNVRFVEI